MPAVPVLINPRSGGGFSDDQAERIRQTLGDVRIEPTSSREDVMQRAREAARAHSPLVVAGGGDGTMNAIASVLAGTETALGVLPLGTLNHFARDLGVSLTLDEALKAIAAGKARTIDVGEVNGQVFVNNSSIGLYPAIVRHREKQQRRLGRSKWHAMLWAMHAVLRSHPFLDLTLELDGKVHRPRTPFVFIGNNVYSMEGFYVGLRERLDAGVLSVYLAHRAHRLRLFRLALRALFGRLHQANDFEAATTRELRIDSRHTRLLVATDGEVNALELPLEYRIRPGALKVIAP